MILEIIKYPNKILTKKTTKVVNFDKELQSLIDNMTETMYAKKGAGLAANQVGVSKQIALVDVGEGLNVLVNPKIISQKGKAIAFEGCLSFPDLELEIKRPRKIAVRFQDRNGRIKIIKAQDFLARAICHEIDHLQGKTFLSRIPFLKRIKIKRQLKKNFSN